MNFILQPWQLVFMILAGWVNREQQETIEYLRTENQVLKEKIGKKRILLNNDQRRRLAVKGKILGRRLLEEVGTLCTPDTILRRHRMLVAKKWDYSQRRKSVGRPRVVQEIVDLVLRFARENPTWGYDKIQGALANLGHDVSDQTVGNILKRHGLEPVRDRKRQTTWKTFIRSHWGVLASIDFTTIEVWMKQVARNLTDSEDGFLNSTRYLIMDRDGKFCPTFCAALKEEDIKCVRLPPRSPNLTPHIERFMRSIKEEALERMILFGEKMLRATIQEYLVHYHTARNHQGIDNRIIDPGEEVGQADGEIQCRERLGGLLRYYHRKAA